MQSWIILANQYSVATLLGVSAASVILGDLAAKYWSLHQRPVFLFLALLGYFGSGFFYIPTLLRSGLVLTSVIWSVLSILGFLVVGLIIFHEVLTPLQLVGVAFGVLGILILTAAGL